MLNEIERFVNWMRRRNSQAHTWRDYRCDLEQFAAVVGNRPAEEITFRGVDTFVATQVEEGLTAATINRRLAAVLSFYTFLSDEIRNWSARFCPTAITCESGDGCPGRYARKIWSSSWLQLRKRIPMLPNAAGTGRCSC